MRILFVSNEDRCRGPMARVLAERMAAKTRLHGVVFDSAGLDQTKPQPPDLATAAFLNQEKVFVTSHRSKPLTAMLGDGADIILCMTRELTRRTREFLGPDMAPKVVLYNDAIMLATKRMDIDPPESEHAGDVRRLYAALLASTGRLVRMLDESDARPEDFGARTVAKKYKPTASGPRASETTVDPEKRMFLANTILDLVERSFEPERTVSIQEQLAARGQQLSIAEVEEILRQDLHGCVRVDSEGIWHAIPGAAKRRTDKARKEARARIEEENRRAKSWDVEPEVTAANALEVLGFPAGITLSDAQKKYRALLQRYHPDKFHDDPAFADMAKRKVQRINRAWEYVEQKLKD